MINSSISSVVDKIVMETLSLDEDIYDSSTSLYNLGADDLDVVELVMAIEEEVGTSISESDFDGNLSPESLSEIFDRVA